MSRAVLSAPAPIAAEVEAPERRIAKLERINAALMRRVEQTADRASAGPGAYDLFERAATLEAEVRARTGELGRAIDLLNESNARLEAARADLAGAIEAVQEGFALFDRGDRLVLCNSRFGRDLPDVRPRLVPGLAFDDYVSLVSRSAHVVLGSETPEAWAAQRRRAHAAGHAAFNVPIAGERWLQVSERRTATGGTVILQTDVTDILRLERRERERLLDAQARVVRATLDHIDQGVCAFDAEARLIAWNAQAGAIPALPTTALRLGMGFGPLLAALAERWALEPRAEALLGWARHPASGPLAAELRRAGRAIRVVGQAMPGGFLVSFADVTAEREALRVIREANETLERRVRDRTLELEDALEAAERANATKSRFVAAASHDLLQPLSAAKLYLGSLEFDAEDPRAGAAAKASRAMESVEAMLDALLHISRLDSGRHELHVEAVPLGPILRRLREEFAPAAEAKGIALTVVPTREAVRSDATYLRRILQNLIANAVRYTEAGRVLVGARRRGGLLRLDVIDTGPGIAETDLEAVFQEFRRLRDAAGEGMGLGLAIVERACGLLGHPLEVASEVGRGTRFSVGLPLMGGRGAAETDASPLLLVIGAEPGRRERLARRLEAMGLDAIEAADPAEAEALLAQVEVAPDAALLADPDTLAEARRRLGPLPLGVLGAAGGPPDPPTRPAIEALIARAPG